MKSLSIYFSTSGESEKVAQYYAEKLDCPCIDLTTPSAQQQFDFNQHYQLLIVTFPVHCQHIPQPFKPILKKLKADAFIINLTYGRMSFGNCLFETAKLIQGKMIGASLIPAKHTYLNNESITNLEALDPIIANIPYQQPISIPKFKFHPLANFFPKLRSQIGVKILKTGACSNCNFCTIHCPTESIICGEVKKHKCIRCLKCIYVCPHQALMFKLRKPLKIYLRKEREQRYLIFTHANNLS